VNVGMRIVVLSAAPAATSQSTSCTVTVVGIHKGKGRGPERRNEVFCVADGLEFYS
jgi:hypothetical protein